MPTYRNDSGRLLYAEDTTGNIIAVADGQTVQTYKRLADLHLGAGWTLTSEQPYFNIAMDENTITATEAGWQELSVDPSAAVLDIHTTAEITIHANSQSAGGLRLKAGGSTQIANAGRISLLHIYFSGAGTVICNEIKE